MRDYREDLKVDKYDLDTGLANQAQLATYWGTKWAKAVSSVAYLKTRLTIKKAEIAKELRTDTSVRITDSMVENACFTDELYLRMHHQHIQATEDMNVLEVAYNKFYDRGRSLNSLKDMWEKEYYSTIPTEVQESREREEVRLNELEVLEHNERLQRIHGTNTSTD